MEIVCFGMGEDVIAAAGDLSNISPWEVGFFPGFDKPVYNGFHSVCNNARDDFLEG